MTESQPYRRIPTADRRAVSKLIAERPVLPALRVGYHLRNEAEALDLFDLLNRYVPQRWFTGLAGSRLAGVIIHSERRLMMKYQHDMPVEIIRGIRREWPVVAATADGRMPLQLPTVRHEKLENRPANAFFYDIDAVVIPKRFDGEPVYETEIGERSGTKIEVFIVSPQRLLEGGHPFYPSIFLNSQRLPYPYQYPRKQINFARIFNSWQKKAIRAVSSADVR